MSSGHTWGKRSTTLLSVGLIAIAASACTSAASRSKSQLAAPSVSATTRPPQPGTPISSTITPGVDPPTTIVTWGTYRPSYNTIGALAADSTSVFIATVGQASTTTPDAPVPLVPRHVLLGTVRTGPYLTVTQAKALGMITGHTYLVFYGIDTTAGDPTSCIVGGHRGVFAFDATTNVVTRLDDNPQSQIARTEHLAVIERQITFPGGPIPVPPLPVCAPSATGI